MNDPSNDDQVTRTIEFKSTRNFNQLIPDLIEMGHLDQDQQAIGAGVHLVPLLQKALVAIETVFQITVQAHSLEDDEVAPTPDGMETMESFHESIQEAVKSLEEAGYENPKDLAFELIFPHMNWVFCTMYATWCTQMRCADIIINHEDLDLDVMINEPQEMLKIFQEYSRRIGAVWSVRIAERALEKIG